MRNKVIILSTFFALFLNITWGQVEVIIVLQINEDVHKTENVKFSILTKKDTSIAFSTLEKPDSYIKEVLNISMNQDTLTGLFEYREKSGDWKKIKYSFDVDTMGLKRIEVFLDFTVNESGTEFLHRFTVDKFYYANSVSMKSVRLKVGASPLFMLVNNSDTTFFGASPTNHFSGMLSQKYQYGWLRCLTISCLSCKPEKLLLKSDSVYSWPTGSFTGDEYVISEPGIYKYVVPMGLTEFSDISGVYWEFFHKGETRMRTRTFYEVEEVFILK